MFVAQDIESVAEFWAALLGVRPTFRSDDWIALSGEVNVSVQRSHEHRPRDRSGPFRPQQVHLDIEVEDIGISERIVIAHGGTKLAEHPEAHPDFASTQTLRDIGSALNKAADLADERVPSAFVARLSDAE